MFWFVGAIIVSYLIGSLSFSTIISHWVANIDIRKHGSGNAGATNTVRVLGLKWGLLVLLLDVAKGLIVILGTQLIPGNTPILTYSCGIAVIAGHNWPLFFRFRGGKGVATTIGVLAVTLFHTAWIAGAFALAILIVTRYVSLGSLTFTALVPILCALVYPQPAPTVFSAIIALFSIYRHKQNIVRLWTGTERRLLDKSVSEKHKN